MIIGFNGPNGIVCVNGTPRKLLDSIRLNGLLEKSKYFEEHLKTYKWLLLNNKF